MNSLIRSLNNDLKFGLLKEINILPTIQYTWKEENNIRNTKDIYNDDFFPYDFESVNFTSWEVKSRRITKHHYPTTIIPVHKIRNVETPQFYVFNFTDTCCYIEYDVELFKTFKKRMINVIRLGGSSNPVNHYEIPVNELIDMIRIYKE